MCIRDRAITLFAVTKGYLDDVPVDKALAFEGGLRNFLKSKYAVIVDKLTKTNELTGDDEKALSAAIEDFRKTGTY